MKKYNHIKLRTHKPNKQRKGRLGKSEVNEREFVCNMNDNISIRVIILKKYKKCTMKEDKVRDLIIAKSMN